MKFEKVESPDWYDSMPSTSDGLSPASDSAFFIGSSVRWMRSSTSCSNLARVSE